MSITLELQPEVEQGLLSQAQARGVTLVEYVQEIVVRQAHVSVAAQASAPESEAKNLVELFAASPFKGLSMEFERDKDYGREIDL
jgi:hypothetical protein